MFTSQTERLHIYFQIKSTVCCRAVTISDLHHTIINNKRIHDNNIIAVSREIWKNMLVIKLIFIFVYCVFCLLLENKLGDKMEQVCHKWTKGQLHSVIVKMQPNETFTRYSRYLSFVFFTLVFRF